jgi:hypothetical protein
MINNNDNWGDTPAGILIGFGVLIFALLAGLALILAAG